MAQSVKLKDGSLIDASAVYDANEGKTQQEVNEGKLDKTGGRVTGNITFEGELRSEAPSKLGNSNFILVPRVPYTLIEPTHTNEKYFEEYLKWLCATYPGKEDIVFIGVAHPSGKRLALVYMYSTNDIDSNGLPYFAFGMEITNEPYLFGSISYTYYYKAISTS